MGIQVKVVDHVLQVQQALHWHAQFLLQYLNRRSPSSCLHNLLAIHGNENPSELCVRSRD